MSILEDYLIIKSPEVIIDGEPCVVITNTKAREHLITALKADAKANHKRIPDKDNAWNSIHNDDYLFIKDIILSLEQLHRNMFFCDETHQWENGNRALPYIDVLIRDGSQKELSEDSSPCINEYGWPIINDKTLVCHARELNCNYAIEIDQYWFPEYIKLLYLLFDNNEELSLTTGSTKLLSIPLKKSIFLTDGFSDWFEDRSVLVGNLFFYSVETIITHEVAHIARGHTKLANCSITTQKLYPLMEFDADTYASRWMLDKALFPESSSSSLVLPYYENDFITEISLKLFAFYLVTTWLFLDETREWNKLAIQSEKSVHPSHPPYQLRAFHYLNQSLHYLRIWATGQEKVHFGGDQRTFTVETIKVIWEKVKRMIVALETTYNSTLLDTRTTEEKLRDNTNHNRVPKAISSDDHMFSDLLLEEISDELNKYYDDMPILLNRLEDYNLFRK